MSFRLASLLKIRRIQADAAASRAGAANAAVAASARTVEQRQSDLASMGHAGSGVDDVRIFRASVAARSGRASLYTEAVADAAQSETDAVVVRQQWADARRTVRTLERLEERHLAQQQAAETAAEQVVLDEHGTRSRAAAVRDARIAAGSVPPFRASTPTIPGDRA